MSDRGSLENLKQEIVENIYTNENQAVTGDLLQDVLIDAVDTMGVSVSQNSQTGNVDITVGDVTTPVASVQKIAELKSAIDLTEGDLEPVGGGMAGFITETGDLDTSVSNAYFQKYKVDEGYGIKVEASSLNAPITNAKLWAIYSSDTIFDSTTCIAISDSNAKAETIETFVAPANAKIIILQKFYGLSTTCKLLQNTATKTSDNLKELTKEVSKKKRSDVFIASAIVNTSLPESIKDKYLDGIVSLKIKGISNKGQYIVSNFTLGTYSGRFFISLGISKIENNSIVGICSFYKSFSTLPVDSSLSFIPANNNYSDDVYFAECCVNFEKIGTELFNNTISSLDSDTYKNYGIEPDCFDNEIYESALPNDAPNRLRREIRKIEIKDLDSTRKYLLKTFGYDSANNLLSISICTTENLLNVYSISKQIGIMPNDIETITVGGVRVTLDFSIINNDAFKMQYTTSIIPSENTNRITVSNFEDYTYLLPEEEMSLTYDGEPMKLLDYGKISEMFYLASGNHLLATKTISKQSWSHNDNNLKIVYTFPNSAISNREFIEGINAVKELNNGHLIVNVAVNSYSDNEHTDHTTYSIYYRWDGTSMVELFVGNWYYNTFSSGVTKSGGSWTAIWDFDEYENLVFISERCAQNLGGRAWMSKDGGFTWYVIFNAFTASNSNLYKVVQPSGWDNTDPEHPDFKRIVPGLNRPNFHIHGIAYDRWRDNVIIVSGDASFVKGSYTAVWILHNPAGCTIYPASGDIPEGATDPNNPVKMLQCTWRRVGLYNDENSIEKNLQFVNTLPLKDMLLFGSDCGGGGINGVIKNTYPENIVGSNFRVAYPLNADNDNALTHCSGGILKLMNGPYLWVFHREGSGFGPTSSDQRAAILSSYNGKVWKRAWDDDTFNYDQERGTKISWGATVIGYKGELYLRYKGFNLNDNIIRRMVLCE